MLLHRMLSSVRPGCDPGDVRWPKFEAWKSELRSSNKFEISEEAMQFVDDMPDWERQSQCLAMVEAGVFRMPFDDVLIQSSAFTRDGERLPLFTHVVWAASPDGSEMHRVRYVSTDARGGWMALCADIWVDLSGQGPGFSVYASNSGWGSTSALNSKRMASWLAGSGIGYVQNAAVTMAALILLTSTRGIVRERVSAGRSSARLARLRRVEPKFDHTLVRLDPSLRHMHGKTYLAQGRAVCRLHWRRGHARSLPDGRKTWVRAHLVGHDDQGRVTHDYSLRGRTP